MNRFKISEEYIQYKTDQSLDEQCFEQFAFRQGELEMQWQLQ